MKKIKFVSRAEGHKGVVAYIAGKPAKVGEVLSVSNDVAADLIFRKKAEEVVEEKKK